MTLRNKLLRLIKRHGGEWIEKVPAYLGNLSGVVPTGEAGFDWARFTNGQEVKVLNRVVAEIFDTKVLIGRSKTMPQIWQVIATRETYLQNSNNGTVAFHAPQHYILGPDPVFLDYKQIIYLSILPSDEAPLSVRVYGGVFPSAIGYGLVNETSDLDLSSYIPVAGAIMASIEADDAGAITVNDTGTNFGSPEVPLVDRLAGIPVPDPGKYPIAFVLLYETQAQIKLKDILIPKPLSVNPGNFQPLDGDLSAIASLNPEEGELLQYLSGAWTNVTPAVLFDSLPQILTDDDCNILFDDDCEILYSD
jgi:hypothetical protein